MHFFFSFSLACRCAERALQKGYTVFGLQFYGECWSGQNAEFNFNREGAAADEKCMMNLNKPTECVQSSDQECVGTQWTNYVYKLTESKLNVGKKNLVTSQFLKMLVFLCREENRSFQCLSVSLQLWALSFQWKISVFEMKFFQWKNSVRMLKNVLWRMEQHFRNFRKRGEVYQTFRKSAPFHFSREIFGWKVYFSAVSQEISVQFFPVS